MKKLLRFWLFALCSTLTIRVHAAVFDANVFYLTDSTTASTDSSHSVTAYNFFLGFALDKKGMYNAGWNYGSYTTATEDATSKIDYKSTEMGPAVFIFLGKEKSWAFNAAYNLKSDGTYKKGSGTEEDWRGSTLFANLGYQAHFGETFSLAIRMNYLSATWGEQIIGTAKTEKSYAKDMIYPSIGLTFEM